METLVLLLLFSSANLVFSDDSAAIEKNAGYQVHAPTEENGPENDQQLAESSHVISHSFRQNVQGAKDVQEIREPHEVGESLAYSDKNHLNRNGDVRYTYEVQNTHKLPQQQAIQYLHENIRQKPIVVNEGGAQSLSNQVYSHQEQQLGVQQYPSHHTQIYGAQASPLQQAYENEHAIGYQTYVEHLPEADDEEIKSALKENSLGDIKRLVPKSGISFKIYHNEKAPNLKVTEHKVEIQPDVSSISTEAPHGEFLNSVLHHRVRVQAPVQQLQIQSSQTHQQSEPEKHQQTYAQQSIGHSLMNQIPAANAFHEGQNLNTQIYYSQQEVSSPKPILYTQTEVSSPKPVLYTQTEVSSPKPILFTQMEVSSPRPVVFTQTEVSSKMPILEITGKGIADPPYKIKSRDEHLRATSKAEFIKNTGGNGVRQNGNHLRLQKSRNNFHKTLKHLKPENVQHLNQITEGVQKLTLSQNEGLGSYITHEEADLYENGLKNSNNGVSHQITPQDQYFHSKTFADPKAGQPLLNRLSGSYINEAIKSDPAITHLGANVYTESQYVNTKSNFGHSYADNDPEKTQHSSLNYETQFNIKSSPNNFDHQKALEGSTSFDIKNAIGNTEGTEIQAGYVTTTEIHPTEQLQKQQLIYSLPSVPTVLPESNIFKNNVEGHQIKTIGQVTSFPQFAYHQQELGDKLYRQPQFVFTSEYLKPGNELHQPLIKLHIPKEEIQYLKSHKLEIPNIIAHQHQPLLSHQNGLYKAYGLQFQHKKPPQAYQSNLKLSHPVIIDWSLFKSKFPNININSFTAKPELVSYIQDPTKKIMPILVRKRKNRSNNKEVGVVYGKATHRGPVKPSQRQEKNVLVNLIPSATNDVNQYETKNDRKNEFSVSASYKVDRSYKSGS